MQDALGLRTDVAPHGYAMQFLLNILNGCVKVYSQMISLLFLSSVSLQPCRFSGQGLHFYGASMTTMYMIIAKLERYTCMVDLPGCAGYLQEAENMIKAMPCKPLVAVWMALQNSW
jgi:hypothetical protein